MKDLATFVFYLWLSCWTLYNTYHAALVWAEVLRLRHHDRARRREEVLP